MHAQDKAKEIMQAYLGPGHLVSDEESSWNRLHAEWQSIQGEKEKPFTELSEQFGRYHLSSITDEAELRALHRMFLKTAALAPQDFAGFERAIEARVEQPQGWMHTYLETYRREGKYLVSHSAEYREAHHPAYQVIATKYVPYLPLCAQIERQLAQGRVTLAMDGRCGSGKSTHAAVLRELYDCPVVSMDDFFLSPELRSQARLAQPGENIHHERFWEEVALPRMQGKAIVYRPFDCSCGQLGDEIALPDAPLLLVEGSYALHPKLAPLYDLRVFSTVTTQEQEARLLAREGESGLHAFQTRWIPLEERYFEACQVEAQCDIILSI